MLLSKDITKHTGTAGNDNGVNHTALMKQSDSGTSQNVTDRSYVILLVLYHISISSYFKLIYSIPMFKLLLHVKWFPCFLVSQTYI